MVSVQVAASFGVLLSGAVLIGNHFYVKSCWKAQHPLLAESIELLLKDPAVVRELGPKIVKKGSSVNGVLDSGRKWANFNFEVEGTIRAQVNIVADAKPASEVNEGECYTEAYRDYESTLMVLNKFFIDNTLTSNELRWKIANLTLTIDDWVNIEVVNGTKTHQDVKQKENILTVEPVHQSVGVIRRKKQIDSAFYLYWKMVFAGIFSLAVGIYINSLYKHQPVTNSVLLNKSLEILKTNEVIRNQIGLPINSFPALKGFMNYNGTRGSVTYYIFGQQGFAKVDVSGVLDKKKNVWNFQEFTVERGNEKYEIKD
jgi:hypothetical protein